MGLLSKLLGNDVADKLQDALSGLSELAKKAAEEKPSANPGEPSFPKNDPAPFGASWGTSMPAEPNQYNYPGDYRAYFQSVFAEEFPGYQVTCEEANKGRSTVYTFYSGGRQALVVEVMSETSEARAVARNCAAIGVPYLRYYYNHHGWWNTRSYVTARTRAALNG